MHNKILGFEELVAPLSKGKVLVLIEQLGIGELMFEDASDLVPVFASEFGFGNEEWEDFLYFGFLMITDERTDENIAEGHRLIRLFNDEKYVQLLQVDLFVDGMLIDSTFAEPLTVHPVIKPTRATGNSVVIRFPIERINRRKEPKEKK